MGRRNAETNGVVAITDLHGNDASTEERLLAAAGLRLEMLPSRDQLLNRSDAILALGVRHFKVDEALLRNLPRCRVVARYGVGYDNIDVRAATECGVMVTYAPDYCTHEVAEQALAGALLHIRATNVFRGEVRAGRWTAQGRLAQRADAMDLVVVGLGRIGSALASKAKGVGFRVSAYDPFVPESRFHECGVTRVPTLEKALACADILSLHVPLTKPPSSFPTRRMIAAKELATMKPTAMLINTSRGPVVDDEALCLALESGRPGEAFLDVLEHEPPQGTRLRPGDFPVLDRLARLDSVVLTPHCSFNSEQSVSRVKELGTNEICRVLRGQWPRPEAWVNPEVRGRFAERFGCGEA